MDGTSQQTVGFCATFPYVCQSQGKKVKRINRAQLNQLKGEVRDCASAECDRRPRGLHGRAVVSEQHRVHKRGPLQLNERRSWQDGYRKAIVKGGRSCACVCSQGGGRKAQSKESTSAEGAREEGVNEPHSRQVVTRYTQYCSVQEGISSRGHYERCR